MISFILQQIFMLQETWAVILEPGLQVSDYAGGTKFNLGEKTSFSPQGGDCQAHCAASVAQQSIT